jgi:hypothetical protein
MFDNVIKARDAGVSSPVRQPSGVVELLRAAGQPTA